jgi:hypothetical protein
MIKIKTDMRIFRQLLFFVFLIGFQNSFSQTLSETQMRNARATGYAIVAARNPGKSFSIYVVPWNGTGTLEQNANLINAGWHAQAAIKGNFFTQTFNGSDFSEYSSVVTSEEEFDLYNDYPDGTPVPQWWIVCSTLPPFSSSITTRADGNVGIGVLNANAISAKLTVAGDILSKEIKVRINAGADFVFDEEYNLKDLKEVELYIKENKHLPDIESAKEMEENGVELGKMNIKLLQKIEELTLYMIDFKNQLDSVKAENKELKREMNQLERH